MLMMLGRRPADADVRANDTRTTAMLARGQADADAARTDDARTWAG